jgi:hypothetical protein
MLYICKGSNKFDLNQAIRVSHKAFMLSVLMLNVVAPKRTIIHVVKDPAVVKVVISYFFDSKLELYKKPETKSSFIVSFVVNHRDKTRIQMPAKMFPHLKLYF